jgi:hypothetical protein
MIEILAVLSVSAAAGMRVALPLLIISLLEGKNSWANFPPLSWIPSPVILGILVSWSIFELFASKKLLGQRILQIVQLVCSPFVGALLGIAVANLMQPPSTPLWLMGLIGGLLALVLQLVQAGWFYRLHGLPLWAILLEDMLCVVLVLLALDAPKQGGLVAVLLLWLAIRSSKEWRNWYLAKRSQNYTDLPSSPPQGPD